VTKWFAVAIAVAAVACRAPGRLAQSATVTGDWVQSYALPANGQLQIVNTTGKIEMESAAEGTVEVHAERVAHATTDQGARDLLSHITIHGDTGASGLIVETDRIRGVLVGVSFEVNYHVKFPSSASISARTANGSITITGAARRASASVVNGGVIARGIAGGLELRSTNGNINAEIRQLTKDFIDLRSVNGRVDLQLPPTADANLSATSANGRVDIAGLPFENYGDTPRDASSRRVRGRINAGGTPIEISAVNGGIRVSGNE
jgi:DUF4097 and DUF4098 domain-containing protein YvlB